MFNVVRLKLAKLLKEKGLNKRSVRGLARELGISHVALWEMIHKSDYNPSLAMLDRLCAFFGCGPGDLLERVKGRK